MVNKTFGEFLKEVRQSRGWSQIYACKGVCDRRTYIRWEQDLIVPTAYNLHQLSRRFNMDFSIYYKHFIINSDTTTYKLFMEAERYIVAHDWSQLNQLIISLEKDKRFLIPENRENLFYYKALYSNKCLHNYDESCKFCIIGLKEEIEDFTIESHISEIYTNTGLCLLNCLATNYIKLENYSNAFTICNNLLENIEKRIAPEMNFYQSTEFPFKIYHTSIFNLALTYKYTNQPTAAIETLSRGINYLVTHDCMYQLFLLYKQKYKLEYDLELYSDAQSSFLSYYSLCVIEKSSAERKIAKEDLQKRSRIQIPDIWKTAEETT